MAMILFSPDFVLTLTHILRIHCGLIFLSVFIPSCLPLLLCLGSLLTIFFCNLKYSPLPQHNIPFALSHSLSFPDISNFFITRLFLHHRCRTALFSKHHQYRHYYKHQQHKTLLFLYGSLL